MAKQYVCDRCGKRIDEIAMMFTPSEFAHVEIDGAQYDLCKECAKALKKRVKEFLNNKED